MSQLASGYVIADALIPELAELARKKNHEAFWALLKKGALAVQPEFEQSGVAASVAACFLEERGIALNYSQQHADLKIIAEESAAICCPSGVASAILQKIAALETDEDELAEYFEAFMEEDFDDAGEVMTDALGFIETGLELLQQKGGWLVVFVA